MASCSGQSGEGFATPFGLFQFCVKPFGLCNVPATFQRLMEQDIAGLHWTTSLIYLNDIIFSKSIEKHLEQLSDVFALLNRAGLKKSADCYRLACSTSVT